VSGLRTSTTCLQRMQVNLGNPSYLALSNHLQASLESIGTLLHSSNMTFPMGSTCQGFFGLSNRLGFLRL